MRIRAEFLATLAIAALVGVGCTSSPSRHEAGDDPLPAVLQELGATLPGRYISISEGDDDDVALVLRISVESPSDESALVFILNQQTLSGDDDPRRFLLRMADDGEGPERLEGEFAPLDRSGSPRRRCAMTFRVREGGLIGETDPESCRFGEGGRATGLLKEIAFDGHQLVIGDRLIELPGGEPAAPDRVHAFYRARSFQGWAGVREGGAWRTAKDFELDPSDAEVVPSDAAGMELGIRIRLSFYRMQHEDGELMLRLTVTDRESGDLLGESWADPDSRSIGLSLPEIQVGLSN